MVRVTDMKQILDSRGRLIGYMQNNGNVILALNAKSQVVGRYHVNEDYTYDGRGAKVGRGNLLTMLFSR